MTTAPIWRRLTGSERKERPMHDDSRPSPKQTAGDTDRQESWQAVELQRLVADIAARLRNACAHLPDDDFSALVLDIAQRRMRFDAMDPMSGPDRQQRD